jgi:hypothetical protein
MGFFQDLFFKPYPSDRASEVERMMDQLVKIGLTEDFLCERFTPGFNSQMRNVQARDIGKRLDEIGGMPLMEFAQRYVRRKAGRKQGKALSEHLEYCWDGVGKWKA